MVFNLLESSLVLTPTEKNPLLLLAGRRENSCENKACPEAKLFNPSLSAEVLLSLNDLGELEDPTPAVLRTPLKGREILYGNPL